MSTENSGLDLEATSKDENVEKIIAILADLLEIDVREIKHDTSTE